MKKNKNYTNKEEDHSVMLMSLKSHISIEI